MTPIVTVADAVVLSLVFTRVVALFLAFPFFNTTLLPMNVKIFLVVGLSFFIVKIMNLSFDITHFSWGSYFLLILKEMLIGFSLGVMANIFLAAFSYAAEVVSYFMGLTIANVFDPTYGQVSILSRLFIFLFYIIFFVSGAYSYMLFSLISSFEYIPIFKLVINGGIFEYVTHISSFIFVLGFKLAFPFALILFSINLSLALVNRLIPQINVFIVGLPLQIFVGLAALAFGAGVIIYFGESVITTFLSDFLYVIKNIGK